MNDRLGRWLEANQKSREIDLHGGGGESDVLILIAKVLSRRDVFESLLDVVEVTSRPFSEGRSLSVHWKFFFFEEDTRNLMEAGLKNFKMDEGRTQPVLEPNKMKPYFWSRHLAPASVPSDVDYVWLLDGDISLRHMAWECFWTIAHDQLRPNIFQPAILFLDAARERSKTGWSQVVHPSRCEVDGRSQTFSGLAAIETGVVENQLAVFRRGAWEVVYNQFTKQLGDWGSFDTSWGNDMVWCGILEKKAHKLTPGNYLTRRQGGSNSWQDVENTCEVETPGSDGHGSNMTFSLSSVELVQQTLATRQMACAVIHATPVVHLDTMAESDEKKGDSGFADGERFRQAFPDEFFFNECNAFDEQYFFKMVGGEKVWLDRGRFRFWRTFTNDTACQACKSYQCIPKLSTEAS